jgi:hypothetical protein
VAVYLNNKWLALLAAESSPIGRAYQFAAAEMGENLTNTSWKEIQGRHDVLTLGDQQVLYLDTPLGQELFSLCWHSERFTLQVTRLDAGKQTAIRQSHPCLPLEKWPYVQVDELRPNYRILLKLVYDSQQLHLEVIKDAKMRFPGPLGDVKLKYN